MSMLDSFLNETLQCLQNKNGQGIANLIHLDFESLSPDRQKPYAQLNGELNASFPKNNDSGLVGRCKQSFNANNFGSFSTSFSDSIVHYFRYLRDFATATNLTKALEIRQLTSQCITALGDSRYGVVMIPIVLSFSRTLATIATNLDRNAALHSQANLSSQSTSDSTPNKVTFVEDVANVLRDAFIKCLAGSPGVQRTNRPTSDDKRVGIYLTANSTLKLLFQCHKLRNAQQMFLSIDAQSPPLSYYPAAQRVTYLYLLGRYHFANSHMYRAATVLQSAYDQCHSQALKQRRLILLYLIAANVCLGRLPSSKLLMRREASISPDPSQPEDSLAKRFLPLCQIIKTGDLASFHMYLSLSSPTGSGQFFLRKRMLLQLQNRCELLVWRSFIRKCFVIAGYKGEEKKIPFLRLPHVQSAAKWCLTRPLTATGASIIASAGEGYVDPDLADIDAAINETGYDPETGTYQEDMIGQHTPQQPQQSIAVPDLSQIEAIHQSLIQQALLRGFLTHANPRFAIPGSKNAGGPTKAAFPAVWDVVRNGESGREGFVPGWVTEEAVSGGGGAGLRTGGADGSMAGRVVRLSGARPVGMGA